MNADGSGKHRIKSYLGQAELGQWVPGERWLSIETNGMIDLRASDGKSDHVSLGEGAQWLLDAATGCSKPVPVLPAGYWYLYSATSPDQTKVAFSGSYSPNLDNTEDCKPGVYVFDRVSGKVTQILSGDIKTAPAWAPDSRHIAVSSGQGYTIDHKLLIINTQTGQVRDLGINGAGACFSPDGRKIAFCSGFRRAGGYFMGVPITGSIFVLDLASGAKPIRITPVGKDIVTPRWSPDGTRLLCSSDGWSGLSVMRSDGSEAKVIYTSKTDGDPRSASWAPSGNAVYATICNSTRQQPDEMRMVVIAADGSSIRDVPVENEKNSNLPTAVGAQTEAGCAAIETAVKHYSAGLSSRFKGNIDDARANFAQAADVFERLVWDYPLSGLTPEDTLPCADEAAKLAYANDDDMLAQCCDKRIEALSDALFDVVYSDLRFPPDMASLEKRILSTHPDLILQCPGTSSCAPVSYVYSPPAPGVLPNVGDTIISCPTHDQSRVVWKAWMSQSLDEKIVESLKPGQADTYYDTPFAFENVGDKPLDVVYHKFTHKYEVKGTAKLLPLGKVYSNEQFSLPDDEGGMARMVDASGALDWGHLDKSNLCWVESTLKFCRAVAKYEAGQPVAQSDLDRAAEIIDGEPALLMYSGSAGGSCGAVRTELRFELIGPGNIRLYQLKPSGRFRVYGTVRVQQTGQACKNGWIDKDGHVTSTEK